MYIYIYICICMYVSIYIVKKCYPQNDLKDFGRSTLVGQRPMKSLSSICPSVCPPVRPSVHH